MSASEAGSRQALRLAALTLPFVPLVLFHRYVYEPPALPGPVRAVLVVVGSPWGWPNGAARHMPLAYGLMGLTCIAFGAALLIRRNHLGVYGMLVWTLFWGWMLTPVFSGIPT